MESCRGLKEIMQTANKRPQGHIHIMDMNILAKDNDRGENVAYMKDRVLRSSQSSIESCDSGFEGSLADENHTKNDALKPTDLETTGLQYAQTEFCRNRKIIIRNVPPVTYEEVKGFLEGYGVSNITISKKCRHAIVTLQNGFDAEDIVKTKNKTNLLETEVHVSLHPSENLLCVAHLPFNMADSDFRQMVAPYGELERCFLMRCAQGQSKGYGLVEYVHNRDKSAHVRQMLDGKKLGSCILHCDFIDTCVTGFEDLNSRCLFIDHLPPGFRDAMALRELCSAVSDPQYCQLAVRNEQALGFAVVEYTCAREAERSQRAIHGHVVAEHSIRATFCIPGQRAADVYNRLMTAVSNGVLGRPGLLPMPPVPPQSLLGPPPAMLPVTKTTGPAMLMNPLIQTFLSVRPAGVQGFAALLRGLQQAVVSQEVGARPGLLGRGPGAPVSPLLNPHLQVSLLALLAAAAMQNVPGLAQQITDAQLQPSFPQAGILLTSLMEAMQHNVALAASLSNMDAMQLRAFVLNPLELSGHVILALRSHVLSAPALPPNAPPAALLLCKVLEQREGLVPGETVPDSPVQWTAVNPALSETLQHHLMQQLQRVAAPGVTSLPVPRPMFLAPPRPARPVLPVPPALGRVADDVTAQLQVRTDLQDTQAASAQLRDLLGIRAPPPAGAGSPRRGEAARHASPRRGLLGDRPAHALSLEEMRASGRASPRLAAGPPRVPGHSMAVAALASPRKLLQLDDTPPPGPINSPRVRAFHDRVPQIQSLEDLRSSDMEESPLTRELRRRWVNDRMKTCETPSSDAVRDCAENKEEEPDMQGFKPLIIDDLNTPKKSETSQENQENVPPPASTSSDPVGPIGSAILQAVAQNTEMRTPVGQKRQLPGWLPSPEPSPENDYVGQHSQGLGGHYAASYKKRKTHL